MNHKRRPRTQRWVEAKSNGKSFPGRRRNIFESRNQIGKGVRPGCISSPCLFNLYAEYIMRNTGLEEA